MKRETKGFAIEPLSEDDALGMAIGKVSGDEWLRADTLRRNLRWAALY